MGDYQSSTTVTTDPDALFDYLSDVNNLPDYFAAMQSAEPAEGGAVRTVAEVDGTRREGEAWLTVDPQARTMRWGSGGPSHYGGELEVTGAVAGAEVTVRLHTEHGDGQAIRRGLDETLDHIKQNVEAGAVGPAPSPS